MGDLIQLFPKGQLPASDQQIVVHGDYKEADDEETDALADFILWLLTQPPD